MGKKYFLQKSCESLTCHGYSLTSVSTPPTILVFLLTSPQLHVVGTIVGMDVVDEVIAFVAAEVPSVEVVEGLNTSMKKALK